MVSAGFDMNCAACMLMQSADADANALFFLSTGRVADDGIGATGVCVCVAGLVTETGYCKVDTGGEKSGLHSGKHGRGAECVGV